MAMGPYAGLPETGCAKLLGYTKQNASAIFSRWKVIELKKPALPTKKTTCITLWSLCGVVMVGVAGFTLVSSAFTHSGSLQPTFVAPSEGVGASNAFRYKARIRGDREIFRGNDLFRVSDVTFPADPQPVSEFWDSDGKGSVLFSMAEPIPVNQSLAVKYSLQPRWGKLGGSGFQIFILLVIFQCLVSVEQFPSLLRNRALTTLTLLLTWIAVFCFVIVVVGQPGWVYGDTFLFLNSTVQGKSACMPFDPAAGRFFPFGFLDLNLLVPFGDLPLAYHAERALLFLLTAVLLFLTTRSLSGGFIAGIWVLVFLSLPGLMRIYAEPIFAEAMIGFLIALFLWLYLRAQRTHRISDWVICGLIATFTCYCKEPVFGFFAVFAGIQLVFARPKLCVAQRCLHWFLILNAFTFLAVYSWFCSDMDASYASVRSAHGGITRWSAFSDLATTHLLVPIAIGVGLLRLPSLVLRRGNHLLTFDAALFAGGAYFFAFTALKMPNPYLTIPAYIPWLVALAGYLGAQIDQTNCRRPDLPSAESQFCGLPQFSRWIPVILVVMLLLSLMLPIERVVDEVKQHHRDRTATKESMALFARLADRGFGLYVLYPNEDGFPLQVAEFRHRVLNVFDSNFRQQAINERQPFQRTELGLLATLSGPCVIFVDPQFSAAEATEQFLFSKGFRLVKDAPSFRGAVIYASKPVVDSNGQLLKP